MLQPTWVVLSALLFSMVPAQTKQANTVAASAKGVGASFGVTTGGDACEHLSREECCGQMLEIAGFEAHGDQLPRLVKSMVRLSCMDQTSTVTPQMCRSILTTRGFDVKQVTSACKPTRARNECRKDGACKQCTTDLGRLSYTGAHNVCYAVTFVPEAQSRVVRIGSTAGADSDTRFTISKRRRVQ